MTTVYNKNGVGFDIDAIATDLNGKLDRDCLNVSDTGKIQMAGMGMPSDSYVELTLGASGTAYTAPANGWFCIYALNSVANGSVSLTNSSGFLSPVVRNAWNGGGFGTNIPAAKGDTIYITYDGISIPNSSYYFRFYYAVGSESEAS